MCCKAVYSTKAVRNLKKNRILSDYFGIAQRSAILMVIPFCLVARWWHEGGSLQNTGQVSMLVKAGRLGLERTLFLNGFRSSA